MTLPRERLSYSSPFTRPPLKLPGRARMIVWSVVNIEEWEITRPMARQLSQPPMGQTPIPDMPNWTWYEYGMRVGFWRLLRALKGANVTPTMSINAKVCETYPEVAAAARDAAWEFMAHAYVQMPIQQIEDQRAVIRQSCDVIEKFTGKRPTGWLGPGRGQTFHTLDYVTECGLTWFGDWILDDQPLWVKTTNGPILSIPYSAEINDITLMVSHHHESDVLLKRTIDAFDRLYIESAESTRVLAIGVHPYVTGAAHRIKYFEQLYDYINRHDVVHWTGQQIYDWYADLVPVPRDRAKCWHLGAAGQPVQSSPVQTARAAAVPSAKPLPSSPAPRRYSLESLKDFMAQRGNGNLSDGDVEKLYAQFLEWSRPLRALQMFSNGAATGINPRDVHRTEPRIYDPCAARGPVPRQLPPRRCLRRRAIRHSAFHRARGEARAGDAYS